MVIRFVRIIFLGLCSNLVLAQEYDFSINWENGLARSVSISDTPSREFKDNTITVKNLFARAGTTIIFCFDFTIEDNRKDIIQAMEENKRQIPF